MVRPVELQDAFAKTPAVEKIVQAQKANPENEQRMAQVTSEQKSHETQRKPAPAQHSDEVILHKDRQEKDQKKKPDHDNQSETGEEKVNGEGDAADEEHTQADTNPLPPPSLDIQV